MNIIDAFTLALGVPADVSPYNDAASWRVGTRAVSVRLTRTRACVRLTDLASVRQRELHVSDADDSPSLETVGEALAANGTCTIDVAIAAAEHCLVLGLS